jgi:predicted dehydrogenase
MSDPVRWGILSTARINDAFLGAARAAPNAEVVAVASRDGERARAYAREHDIPAAHASYEALLADDAVEAVYVPLPNSMHLPWAEQALAAGRHVLCEKPLSASVAPVEAAFDAAERAGRLLMEAFMWRYHPQTEVLRRLVADGAVGALRTLRARFSFSLADADDVRWSRELEGGALMDVGSYCVSGLRLLAGEPERVSAERVEGGDGVDARLSGLLRFPGDVLGSFECGFDLPRRAWLEVVGEAGTITSADPWSGRAPAIELHREGEAPEPVPVEADDPYRLEVEDLSAAIRGGAAPRLGRDDAVGQARTLEALYRAAAEGRSVAVAR